MKKTITPSYEEGMKALKDNKLYLAENIFKKLIEKNSNDLNAKFALARVYLEFRSPYKARAIFSQIVENTSNRIHSSMELGKDAIDNSQWDQAGDLLENANSLLGPNIRARNYLKRLYFYTKEFNKREQLLKEDSMIYDLIFNYNFMIGYIRSGRIDKQSAKEYLDEFKKPHLTHLTSKINYYEFIRENFDNLKFTILPNGKPTFKQLVSDDVPYKQKTATRKTVYPEELSIDNRCKYFFDKNPTRGYKGKDKFAGYLIFEYEHLGVCILEKLFAKNKNNDIKQSTANATYIFPTNMTLRLSQCSKSDIISMMKTQPYIKRVIHNSHYYENLEKGMKQVQLSYLEHNQQKLLNKSQFKQMDKIIDEGDLYYDGH